MDGKTFAQVAESKCGKRASEFRSKYNLPKNSSWSAAFVSACADECEVLGVVVPKSLKCQDIADNGTNSEKVTYSGSWIPGACEGGEGAPEPGDVALINWSSDPSSRADSAAIVTSYDEDSDSVSLVIGDYGTAGSNNSSVRMTTYSRSFKCLKGYFRPAWNEV